MKTKIIKKILAIMIASATISATPGIAGAMHNGIQFLGHKRFHGEESEEESEEESGEENNMIVEEELDGQGAQNVNADRYEDFKSFICDAIEVNYDKKYGNTSESLNERVWNFLNELTKFVDDGADKERVAEIVFKLIKTESFSKLYRYKLNRYCPECEFMVGVLDVLKKCQCDQNARPIVLEAVEHLTWLVGSYGNSIERDIKDGVGVRKYKDYLEKMWLDQEKNLADDKPAEIRSRAQEARRLIMDEHNATRTFTRQQEESFDETLRQDIKQQNDLIMSSTIGILDYCCKQKDSQQKIVDLVNGDGQSKFDDKLLKEKPVEILEILRICSDDHAISNRVLLAVRRLLTNDSFESNDIVYGKMRAILDNCSGDMESAESFLYDFVALFLGPKDFLKSKPEVVDKMLTTYVDRNHKDEVKFARIIQGAAQKELIGEGNRQIILQKLICYLEKNLNQSETRSELIKAIVDLVNCGCFNNSDEGSKDASKIIDWLATNCQNIQNDRSNVAKIILELADKDLLNECLKTNHNGNFGQNLMLLMEICSNDVEAASHIAKTIACSLEKDAKNNSQNFVQFVRDNFSTFIGILSKCSQNSQNLQNALDSMKYIFDYLGCVENRDTLAKIMQQKSVCLTGARSEEQIINILTLCTVDNKMKAVTTDRFQTLFDSYFKENASKEVALKILDLLGNLSTYDGDNESYMKARITNMFLYLVQKFEYEFPKEKMLKIMENCYDSSDRICQRVVEVLGELILKRGKLDEYFVSEDISNENDKECENKIFEILKNCYGNAKVISFEIIGKIMEEDKLSKDRISDAYEILVEDDPYIKKRNQKSQILISKYMSMFLEKYDLPDACYLCYLRDIKNTLSFCASCACPEAKGNVVICINKLVEKGEMKEADADNFKKQLLLQFM